ncbi:unnamed protein product, partial [Amoebophrya sp. A25]|eukprot:GSA25T00027723001.1
MMTTRTRTRTFIFKALSIPSTNFVTCESECDAINQKTIVRCCQGKLKMKQPREPKSISILN